MSTACSVTPDGRDFLIRIMGLSASPAGGPSAFRFDAGAGMTALPLPFVEPPTATFAVVSFSTSASSSDSTIGALLIRVDLVLVDGPAGGMVRPRAETLVEAECPAAVMARLGGPTGAGPGTGSTVNGPVSKPAGSVFVRPVDSISSAKVVGQLSGPVAVETGSSGVVPSRSDVDEAVNADGTTILSRCLFIEFGTYLGWPYRTQTILYHTTDVLWPGGRFVTWL